MTKTETITDQVMIALKRQHPLAKKKLMTIVKRNGVPTVTPQEFNAAILRLVRQEMITEHSSSTVRNKRYLLSDKARNNGWH